VTLLEEGDLSLALSKLLTFLFKLMPIAKLASKQSIWWVVDEKAKVENYIFLKSLLGAIIQDGGIRERRIVKHWITRHFTRNKQIDW